MRKYYELIEQTDNNHQYRSATVIEGKNTGEKILLENGKVIFSSGSFLTQHTEEILAAGNTCSIHPNEHCGILLRIIPLLTDKLDIPLSFF